MRDSLANNIGWTPIPSISSVLHSHPRPKGTHSCSSQDQVHPPSENKLLVYFQSWIVSFRFRNRDDPQFSFPRISSLHRLSITVGYRCVDYAKPAIPILDFLICPIFSSRKCCRRVELVMRHDLPLLIIGVVWRCEYNGQHRCWSSPSGDLYGQFTA